MSEWYESPFLISFSESKWNSIACDSRGSSSPSHPQILPDYYSDMMDIPRIAESAVSYSLANGLLHGETVSGQQYFTHMPLSLFPFPVFFVFVFILVSEFKYEPIYIG